MLCFENQDSFLLFKQWFIELFFHPKWKQHSANLNWKIMKLSIRFKLIFPIKKIWIFYKNLLIFNQQYTALKICHRYNGNNVWQIYWIFKSFIWFDYLTFKINVKWLTMQHPILVYSNIRKVKYKLSLNIIHSLYSFFILFLVVFNFWLKRAITCDFDH